ncbi:MAG TPA: TIGR02679 family protein [Firmicutes bacterium]|nr:TIGR02679 family protein [Bacillota bacterium]
MLADEMQFFHKQKGYKRIFTAIHDRYRSLGRMGGRVTLTNLTSAEREVLSNHLRRDFTKQNRASFGVREFAVSLEMTRFADYSLEEILAAYFSVEELITAKEEARRFSRERREFFEALIRKYGDGFVGVWLRAVWERSAPGSRRILKAYANSPQGLKNQLETVARALQVLEGREDHYWRLPVFASHVTTDPHAFDLTADLGKILVDALCTVYDLQSPKTREEINEVLYRAGLLVDELSNFVTCAGLTAYQSEIAHPVWLAALEAKEPLQVPLLNLSTITGVVSPQKIVFVVENPAVFAGILDAFPANPPPLICTAGQVKMAGLALLDFLAQRKTVIYYSGDLDPEGILIAQRLAERYPKLLKYWRFSCEDYERVLSNKTLAKISIAKLNNIHDPCLIPLARCMEKTGHAAYQELLLPDLIKDMRKFGFGEGGF